MYAQNYLLSLARYLNIGYIDLFDQLFAGVEPVDHEMMLDRATPKIAKLLNCDEDVVTKSLMRCGFSVPPDHCSFACYEWGSNNVECFDFQQLLEYCKNHSFRQVYVAAENEKWELEPELTNTAKTTCILDCAFTKALRNEKKVTVSDGNKEYIISLPCGNTLETFLIYLWKKTHQTSFIWNKPFEDVYHTLGDLTTIFVEDPVDCEQKAYIPVVSAYDTVAELYTAQLNPKLIELYTRKWTSINW